MANNTDVYSDLSTVISDAPDINSDEFIATFLTSTVPHKDYFLNCKTVLIFPKLKPVEPGKKRAKKSYVSRREKLKLGLLKCPKTGWKYTKFAGLRKLWLGYISSYLGLKGAPPQPHQKEWGQFSQLLNKADYHGAELTIVRSKCPNLVGLTGTCVLDSKNTFKILSPDNKCRTIPKADSVFKLYLDNMELTIYGKFLMTKSAERSSKKIKSQIIPDLF